MEEEKELDEAMLQEMSSLVDIVTFAQFNLVDENIDKFTKMLKRVILESRRAGFRNDFSEFKELAEDIYVDILTKLGLVDDELNLPKQ
jgi:hypothetical protein